MAIEAPFSSYKKKNTLYLCLILFGFAIFLGYDGYLSKYKWSMRYSFYKEHVIDNGGVPDGDIVMNRKGAPILAIAGIALVVYYFGFNAKRKVVAQDDCLIVDGKKTIPYDSIEQINKTQFDKKGYFVITYKENGQDKEVTLRDRTYDNLGAVLDHTVSKIK